MDSAVASTLTFDPYVSSVERMAEMAMRSASDGMLGFDLADLLDGQASFKIRETIPLSLRRETGVFFSSSDLRTAALAGSAPSGESGGPILDPAVGAGDLLIEFARHLPLDGDLERTLERWGTRLHGRDTEPAFVRLAKARLVLLAISRGARVKGRLDCTLDDVLPGIQVGDGLGPLNEGWQGGHIVMNPPYTHGPVPSGTAWASGRTSSAAVFLAAAVVNAEPGTRLTAILPDVIRTGTRYSRLRSLVAERLHTPVVEQYGRFDAWTDVDVFILRGVVASDSEGMSSVRWWQGTRGARLGDRVDVRIGPVVPHRDVESEAHHPYLQARALPLGGSFDASNAERRGFRSKLFRPPFVVVRRTSRPGDRARGVGTIIKGTEGVLVENHLIVLKPKDKTLAACHRLAEVLQSTRVRKWLDERIRCRHLTVQALRDAPWSQS